MFTNFFLFFYAAGIVRTFITLATWAAVIPCVFIGIYWGVSKVCPDAFCNEELLEAAQNKLGKVFKKLAIISIICVSLLVIFPEKRHILTYFSLSQVDRYNVKSEDSNLKPEAILKIIDGAMEKARQLLEKDEEVDN